MEYTKKDYKKFRKEVKPVADKCGITEEALKGLWLSITGKLSLPSPKEMAVLIKKSLK